MFRGFIRSSIFLPVFISTRQLSLEHLCTRNAITNNIKINSNVKTIAEIKTFKFIVQLLPNRFTPADIRKRVHKSIVELHIVKQLLIYAPNLEGARPQIHLCI
uniref:Uncharacterized protein n=1 Tax=Myoviridae sp. ct8mY9 TaxID=2827664 RepID=A0A8S5SFP1_9CAUD|nr:MAG TPA: hypothetical protein [Myoviridae sp. ct8mY9]